MANPQPPDPQSDPVPPYPIKLPASFLDDTPFSELPPFIQKKILRALETQE